MRYQSIGVSKCCSLHSSVHPGMFVVSVLDQLSEWEVDGLQLNGSVSASFI